MWPARRPSPDWLVMRSLGVINFLVPAVLGSTAGGQHAVGFSHVAGVSVSAKQLTGHGSEYYFNTIR